ncbi:hypothetical protein AAF712_002652 [Marasmius tenuissimus]|uniref:Uncharacterized protein n=1 Tax=Marasmius tenuissimus TaxID=585030 RepID=A0ABR3A9U9_9AGAR
MAPSGVNITFKELVDALTYKTKAQKDSFLNFSIAEVWIRASIQHVTDNLHTAWKGS